MCVCVYVLTLLHSNLVVALEQLQQHSIENNLKNIYFNQRLIVLQYCSGFLTAVENTQLNFQEGRPRHKAPA